MHGMLSYTFVLKNLINFHTVRMQHNAYHALDIVF